MTKTDKRLSRQDVETVHYLAEKMNQTKNIKLFFKLAHKVGAGELQRNVGLVMEDRAIHNPLIYLIKLCQLEN